MSETGSSKLGADSEIDDPGRDPKGIGGPPRDLFSGGSRSGSGAADTGGDAERDPLMPGEDEEDAAGEDDDRG